MTTSSDRRATFEIYPIEHVDVYNSVLRQLDQLVQSMEPGDRLPPERELVERLQVSRVSVREALRSLESMGRIEIRRNAGSFVVHPRGDSLTVSLRGGRIANKEFLEYLIDVRAAIEDRVVLLVSRDREADFSGCKTLLDEVSVELEAVGAEKGSLDLRFEALLGKLAGNPVLTRLQTSIHEMWVETWTALGIAPGNAHQLHDEHLAILESLEKGEAEQARKQMALHVDRSSGVDHPE